MADKPDLGAFLDKLKVKSNPIENKALAESTDYIKNSYLKMLAAVIQQANVVKEAQTILFERIVIGAKSNYTIQDYFRQSLEIKFKDLESFCGEFKNNEIKYRFILDMLLLAGVGGCEEKVVKVTAGMAENLGMQEDEINYLSALAKSILHQSEDDFKAADKLLTENINIENLVQYNLGFMPIVISCIEDKKFSVYSNGINKFTFSEIDVLSDYRKYGILLLRDFIDDVKLSYKTVIINNVKFNCSSNIIKFLNCNYVEICNCSFINSNYPLYFENCKKVILNNCTFKDFTSRTICENQVDNIEFLNCNFSNCCMINERGNSDWEVEGCVIHTKQGSNSSVNYIKDCVFDNCGGKNNKYYYSSSFIFNGKAKVENCKFTDCRYYHYNNNIYDIDPEDNRSIMFLPGTENINNTIEGSAKFC